MPAVARSAVLTRTIGAQHARQPDVGKPLTGQRQWRNSRTDNIFPRATPVTISRRHEMSSMIEDLARDRMREIQRDGERARQVRRARAIRKSARQSSTER